MINDSLYATDEDKLIDEIFGVIFAGTKTTAIGTTNLIMHLQHNPEVKRKLLSEIDSKLDPISDDLVNKFDYDLAEEFDYVRSCFYESLRIEPLS